LEINGHADASGGSGYNQQLSQDRAGKVLALIQAAGISHLETEAVGRGAGEPVVIRGQKRASPDDRHVTFKIAAK
jgi:outer membrane protein OmpA-like peptidoglycan-associated protein